MTVVIVDWLGRGGIAQTTAAWQAELTAADRPVVVVTRGCRELVADRAPGRTRKGLLAHRDLAATAVEVVHEVQPDFVVFQNYVVPVLERRAHDAARRAGAKVVVVAHDHHLHARTAGTHLGLKSLLQSADLTVCHSEFVGRAVTAGARVEVQVVPLPELRHLLDAPKAPPGVSVGTALALQFGVLKRRYKGSSIVEELARSADEWRFAAVGVGAPRLAAPNISIDAFVDARVLLGWIDAAEVTLFPYSFATQSGGVSLSQSLGTVPVASRIGGIPEQIEHGVTGFLVSPGDGVAGWRAALREVTDAPLRERVGDAARQAAQARHDAFVSWLRTEFA